MSGMQNRGNDRRPHSTNYPINESKSQDSQVPSPLPDLCKELRSKFKIETNDLELLSRGVGFSPSQESTIWTHENLSYFGYGVLSVALSDWIARSHLNASESQLMEWLVAACDQRYDIAYTSGIFDLLTTSGSGAVSNGEMADKVCGLVAALYLDSKALTPVFALVTTSNLVESGGTIPDFSLPPSLAKFSAEKLSELKAAVQYALKYQFSDIALLEQSLVVLCKGETESFSWPALCFVGCNVIKLAISEHDIAASPKTDSSTRILRVEQALKNSEDLLRNPAGVPLAEAFLLCHKGAETSTRESTLHALIGAMYWDAGLPATLSFMARLLRADPNQTTSANDRKKRSKSAAVSAPATSDPINELKTLLAPYSHPLTFEHIEVGSREGPRPGAKIHFPKHSPVLGVGETYEEAEVNAAREAIAIFDKLKQYLKPRR